MPNPALIREKVRQAIGILNEKGIDAWLTFVRETGQTRDPVLDLILDLNVTWVSAFLLTAKGDRIAIVGRFDRENVAALGVWDPVIGYDESIREPLVETLQRLNPREIAINYSENDPAADGLTHGMWCLLHRMLSGTPFVGRLISAEDLIGALRGRKTPLEVEAIRRAVETTEVLFAELGSFLRPGRSEREIQAFVHERMRAMGVEPAWDPDYCPIVAIGPDAPVGHAMPGDRSVTTGVLVHVDMGVRQDGFCSDMQRVWYVLREGEGEPPLEVQRAFQAVRAAIQAGFQALRPGVQGWEVDAAARRTLTQWGYPEYLHALGHHIGRTVHDGSTVLGPRWERYGQTPYGVVEAGNVFTLELGVKVPGYGYIGLEEDVLVTPRGAEWISHPQAELWVIRP
ncbi:Xaa-Pro peptidase family protein [Thermoflexus sp.]|uniref:M24 family metallopeptidase n=1 Tax=Thermoflexus sp. TaxID=1969742 RepID=UPI001778A259|nr:Xaa-Pro peptidase family protein [Thermoflexus sp.]